MDLCLSAGNLAWWEMDVESGKVIFNENKVNMLGYSIADFEDVDYTAFTDIVHPDDYENVMKAMRDHLEGEKSLYEVEYRIKTKNGEYKWFHDRGSIVERNSKGEPVTVKGVVFDITPLKETEYQLKNLNENLEKLVNERTKKLEDSNKKLRDEITERKKAEAYTDRTKENLRNIIDSASEVIISFDMNNRISIWNKTAEKITGYKQIEVLNRSVGKLPVFSKPKDLTKNIELVCGKKHSQSIDVVLQTKENDKLILRMSGSKIYSSDKECVGALFVGKDITKEVELHKKLLEGNSYLIKAKNKLPAIDLIVDLTINAFKGLIVTRGNPEQIKRQIPESKNIEIILLTNQHITGLSTIASLEKLKETFIDFTKKNKKSVILLDGIHYLLSHFSFDEFIKLLYDVNDVAAKNKALLFVRIDPSTIDRHRMAFLENELLVLPNQQTEDLMITDEIYNILKYIYEQNQNNAIVSVKKIMGKFDITYVTAASRLDSLEARGLIYTKKQGKLRTIYIARKGKELIHKRKTA